MSILAMVEMAGLLALGAAVTVLRASGRLRAAAADLIAQAEGHFRDAVKAGGLKFEWVVDRLWGLIPVPLRPFFPRSAVERVVQSTFDAIARYAQWQVTKALRDSSQGKVEQNESEGH